MARPCYPRDGQLSCRHGTQENPRVNGGFLWRVDCVSRRSLSLRPSAALADLVFPCGVPDFPLASVCAGQKRVELPLEQLWDTRNRRDSSLSREARALPGSRSRRSELPAGEGKPLRGLRSWRQRGAAGTPTVSTAHCLPTSGDACELVARWRGPMLQRRGHDGAHTTIPRSNSVCSSSA